jgi:hypothetical protein
MIIICSYCRSEIGEKEPVEDRRFTHGICPVCHDYYIPKLLNLDMDVHLDGYDAPTLMVDADGRVIGVNQPMISFLGKSREQVLGLLGGEIMGCRYAHLPEGCGNTIHCSVCSIRQTVNATRSNRSDQLSVPAYVDRDGVRVHFRISAFHREPFVKVVVDAMTGMEPLPLPTDSPDDAP